MANESELTENSTVKEYLTVQNEGERQINNMAILTPK
jgi:hypothetical protein